MKTNLVIVNRTDDGWLSAGVNEYLARIGRYIPFSTTLIDDIKKAKSFSESQIKEKEGDAILKKIAVSDAVVLMDERGTRFSSRGFAQFMEKQMGSGIKNLFFVIGGAYGFSDEMYRRANYKISLSDMTFPHQMVRLIFAEQLYRALTIINNEPYHHD
ncbi:MAG: 23S rRNA (pseudouridine(1915)-N(3))-methyltransferase RlmH [Cytophagaceae bacterium]|jgi:23S rRNA (pseudouridine1915-N3)-methyltransferase|nr:23S rRNA (pseudouridine(1915)-N(3))-methyltransferase RlmH [Cytophagaceae bacterium]